MNRGWLVKKGAKSALHIMAWLLFFSFPYLVHPRLGQPAFIDLTNSSQLYYFMLLKSTLLIPLFYANVYWLIPRLLYGKKTVKFLLVLIACFIVWVIWDYVLLKCFSQATSFQPRYQIPFNVPMFIFIIIAGMTYHASRERLTERERYKEQETMHLKAELTFLRSQISPHFMFNILNNMVALARKRSDVLEPSLIKLSRLLRYMLYETNESSVPLEREVEYLQSYIDLQKQRFGDYIDLKTIFDVQDARMMIEPMLLIPFVENAFKHCSSIDGAYISISLVQKTAILNFTVTNHFENSMAEPKDGTSGIGLHNVQRRLNLLYQNNHYLDLRQEGDQFIAFLTINLH